MSLHSNVLRHSGPMNAQEWDQIKRFYSPACFAYWANEVTRTFKHDGLTGDDEYGNHCAGPAEEKCPICEKEGA